ncbi:MAG: 1-aminocyclopropane-1-carboxylate deaminase/D-cysteine desulfhydrase [Flavisolibacter sp.]
MLIDQAIHPENIRVDPVHFLQKSHTTVEVVRIDLVHPVISGNKWFKLKEYLKEATFLGKDSILTFGGAYSNHIVATAATTKQMGFKSIGIIRGEMPTVLSHTLKDAISYGMELHFITREQYRKKLIPSNVYDQNASDKIYIINEGGYGALGVIGAADILRRFDSTSYSHIVDVVGTGTTIAGLLESSLPHQAVIGISSMKNNYSLVDEINALVSPKNRERLVLLGDYHFGGYAKYSKQLIEFMNNWYRLTNIPSDFVYTGKLFFAIDDLIQKDYFPPSSKILAVHSGGLQGNQSLPKGTLIF